MAHTPIVDADGHVLEPPTGMAERAPAKFRDRIWQIVTRPDGSEWLRYNGGERPANGLALAGAVRVIRRARELGLVGVFLRPNPSVDGKKFNDPVYDPIWRTCEEVDLPVGLHPFLAPDMPGACRALGFYELKAEGVEMAR